MEVPVGEQARLYYSSGGEHEPGHILAIYEADLTHLRGLQKRAEQCFALEDGPEFVGWMEEVGSVTEARVYRVAKNTELGDLEDQAVMHSGGFVLAQVGLLEGLDPARTEAWEVHFYKTSPTTAQVEWRAKHADHSNYFAAVELT